jgi:hypothetical protein
VNDRRGFKNISHFLCQDAIGGNELVDSMIRRGKPSYKGMAIALQNRRVFLTTKAARCALPIL